MKPKLGITELRELIGAVQGGPSTKERTPFSLFPQGFPESSIIEISGTGKTEFLSRFLKEHPHLRVAWIESQMTINPYALWQMGVNLDQILFVECGDPKKGQASCHVSWTILQILKSQLFQIVIASELEFDEIHLRKFQLLTEQNRSHLFLLSHNLHSSWVPALQIETSPLSEPKLLRKRGFS
jgi:hypothetical protein